MKLKTQMLLELWREARTRFSNQLRDLLEEDLKKKLAPSPNSIGFLLRHIGDVELLFAKNVFGAKEVKVIAKTVIAKKDSGEWMQLPELINYVNHSFEVLKAIFEKQKEVDWDAKISTKEFGVKTKAEALGRIVSHTAYHAGQIALIKKYGTGRNNEITDLVISNKAKGIGNKLGIDWEEVNLDEFTNGINVEFEHGTRFPETNVTDNDLLLTGKIAWAHLKEFPDYYTRLEKMEQEAELFWADKKN